MNIIQLMQTCFRSILRNRMRSLLTSLGIIIGVGSVIIMVAMGEGSQRMIEERITSMGTNVLQITPRRVTARAGTTTVARVDAFNKNDIDKLRNESTYARAISGLVMSTQNVFGPEGNVRVQVQGVEPDFSIARNSPVNAGYFFDQHDLDSRNSVAVLGRSTAESLFGIEEDALYQQIRIGNNYYTVIGLLERKGAGLMGNDQDDVVLLPLDTAMTRISNSRDISQIVMSVIHRDYIDAAVHETELILRESRNIAAGAMPDFAIMNQTDMIDMVSATTQILSTLLASIAGVSLLVGGIGIMNIMMVSVTERTREIGIRMAIGGRRRDILLQFLSEAVILSLMGGLLGISLAFLSGYALRNFGIPTAINPIIVAISALFAAGVGMVFGYYPALKAARLYPIDALRYE